MITYNHGGRIYEVLAKFEGKDRKFKLNAHMRRTLHAVVLCDTGTEIIVVSDKDEGRMSKEPETWEQGWSSLFEGGFRYSKNPPGSKGPQELPDE
jgi:hypothetical protein